MKVSMVTISFNQGLFLEQAINSILRQNHVDVEYIVVDPGSTDGSRDIIKKYSRYIDRVILEPDTGPANGLNKGFAYATGDIFGVLNADDILEPNALASVVCYFEAHSEIDVVSAHGWVIDAEGEKKRRLYSDKFSLARAAYGACILVQPSTFFRASAYFQAGGFNEQNVTNWDSELFIDMALNGARFGLKSEFWSRYRVHQESITGTGKFHDLHKKHKIDMFRKIKGREPNGYDYLLMSSARYARKILNYRDTFERLINGPVYGSYRSEE